MTLGWQTANLGDRSVDVERGRNHDLVLQQQAENRRLIDLQDFSGDSNTVSRKQHNNEEEGGSSQACSLVRSFNLPSELMPFALTYERAYSSSIFTDCWTTEKTLPRLDMPLRIGHPKPKENFECLTCKMRRIMCDELKPHCLRCQKMGLKCGGYNIPQQKSPGSQAVPKRPAVVPQFHLALNPHYPLSEAMQFGSDIEYQFLKVFHKNLYRVGGHGLLIQACHTEPSIRRAIRTLAVLETRTEGAAEDPTVRVAASASVPYSMEGNQAQNQKSVTRKRIRAGRKELFRYLCTISFNQISSESPSSLRARGGTFLMPLNKRMRLFEDRGGGGRVFHLKSTEMKRVLQDFQKSGRVCYRGFDASVASVGRVQEISEEDSSGDAIG